MKKITIGLLLLTGSLFGQVKLNQLAPAPTGSVMTIVTNSTTGVYTYTALGSVVTPTVNGIRIKPINSVYFMGNSLTSNGVYVNRVDSLLGSDWIGYNKGVSGSTTQQMRDRFYKDILLNTYCSYLVVLGGTNDLTLSISTDTTKYCLQKMYTDAHNRGIKVVAMTILPRNATGTTLTNQNLLNNWIKNTAINVDYVVDSYTTMATATTNSLQSIYDSGDGIHLTTLGYQVLGNYIFSHVTWVNTTGTISVSGNAMINQDVTKKSDVLFNTVNTLNVGNGAGSFSTNTALGFGVLGLNTTGISNSGFGYQSLNNNTTGIRNCSFGDRSLSANTTGSENIAVGYGSMFNNSTGGYNTSVGSQAMNAISSGSFNTSVGYQSLKSTTTGSYNIAIGSSALLNNTTGYNNVAIGSSALQTNTTGINNIAIGSSALLNNTTGANNISGGFQSMNSNTSGSHNFAFGYGALWINSSSDNNIAIGNNALFNNIGTGNIGFGYQSLKGNTSGTYNTALGYNSLLANTTGSFNIGIGYYALNGNTIGVDNIAIGAQALQSNIGNSHSIAMGYQSSYITTGGQNVAIGYGSCYQVTTGSSNTFLGYFAGNNASQKIDAVNSMALGNSAFTTKSNQIVLGNASVVETVINGKTILMPSTTSIASENMPIGVAPTTPVNGDVWNDGTNLKTTSLATNQTILKGLSGSFSASATAQTAFVVTFGNTQPNTTYQVFVTPTNALSAASLYVVSKTTTTFTVTFLTGLTGTVSFDWVLIQ